MSRLRPIALLLAASTTWACAAAAAAPWLHVGTPQPVDSAQVVYYQFATKYLEAGLDPSHALKFETASRSFSESEGDVAGDWTFFASPGATLPRSAQRLRVSSNAPYKVDVELYCEGDECQRLIEELRAMRAPRPASNAHNFDAWRKVVAEEPCDALAPAARPPIFYPREELRRQIDGTVVLSVFHNRCGDVRDATISKSSGNRNLDRSAMKQSLKWRIKPDSANKSGWKNEELQFRLDDPANPPPPNAIDVECICD